jgi:hypothetical protein
LADLAPVDSARLFQLTPHVLVRQSGFAREGGMLDWAYLEETAEERRAEWAACGALKYIVFEGLLEPGCCEGLRDFSLVADRALQPARRSHKNVRGKIGSPKPETMTALQLQFFAEINSDRFLGYMKGITGIDPLYADPDLFGGGLHQTRNGGFLNVHTDFNYHPKTEKHRRLNLLLYLNPVWRDEWNGHIELWDEGLKRPVFRAAPLMNRALLFETSETSYHGHPEPMKLPPGVTRQSLAAYYYAEWPEGLGKRNLTGYQLTRHQWLLLMTRVADLFRNGVDDIESVVAALAVNYQTADIRQAYETLIGLRSAPLTPEEYWEYPDGSVSLSGPDVQRSGEAGAGSELKFRH